MFFFSRVACAYVSPFSLDALTFLLFLSLSLSFTFATITVFQTVLYAFVVVAQHRSPPPNDGTHTMEERGSHKINGTNFTYLSFHRVAELLAACKNLLHNLRSLLPCLVLLCFKPSFLLLSFFMYALWRLEQIVL